MSATREPVERIGAPATDVRDRPLGPDARAGARPRRRRDADPSPFPAPPAAFGVGAGRLGTTFGRAMLAWPGRDPVRRVDRR